ncbi:thioredoxin-like protein [Patellaria atrata CBS 101060]|uniref:Thioredoxin-like protein n=1 Tax=Patellaria atrata CBS 101060 TaxID=1346257 RepID=A0A9P4S4T3_9PEZI|nr:thioredoxin-like protein [Patellaria atrata CBS 101060]
MRSLQIFSLSLTLLSGAFAVPQLDEAATAVKKALTDAQTTASAKATIAGESTTFNGVEVPPFNILTGTTIDDNINKGNWLVEFFSPYCHHCQQFAPTWQTLYEFYYTSVPSIGSTQDGDGLNSFSKYYDFKFGQLDCIAFGTACSNHDVHSFPTVILFRDGKEIKRSSGAKSLEKMAEMMEEALESIRPGSRSKDGVVLPKVGAHKVSMDAKPAVSEQKDKNPAAGSAAGSAHNVIASQTVGSVSQPSSTANPKGQSVPLTAENFQKFVTMTSDPWFIKFYAPWCHHCQAMSASWAEMAREMQGKLNIGEVDCESEKRLCKDADVKGYPSMLFFRGGERVSYNGLRGLGDLMNFANSALTVGSGVVDVDAETFKKMEETEEVIFVYFYDHATTTEDLAALDRLTLSLVGHGRLVKTSDQELVDRYKIHTWPRLIVSRDGKPSYFTPLAPKDIRDYRKVLNWMRDNWLPIVPELTPANSRDIMDGRLVVLGILSRDRPDEFIIAKREIKNAALEWMDKQVQAFQLERQELRDAKQLRIEEAEDRNDQRALRAAKSIRINMDDIERREVGFAWVDGVFWERWIRTTYGINVKEGEKVIINDEDNRLYWDSTITGNPIVPSRTSILETLPKVVASPPKLSPKSTISSFEHFFFRIRQVCLGHPWLAALSFVVSLLVLFIWRRRLNRRSFGSTNGFFKLDGRESLLGSNSNEKGD